MMEVMMTSEWYPKKEEKDGEGERVRLLYLSSPHSRPAAQLHSFVFRKKGCLGSNVNL